MTNQDYVTFETAKLLKAAGYPQEVSLWSYLADGKMTCTYDESGCYCDAPHLYDAMKWLRKKGMLVVVNFEIDRQMSGDYPSYNALVYSYGGRLMHILKKNIYLLQFLQRCLRRRHSGSVRVASRRKPLRERVKTNP